MADYPRTATPFWSPMPQEWIIGQGRGRPGEPASYQHIVGQRNELMRRLFGELPTEAGSPYGQSPYAGRTGASLQALLEMARRSNKIGYGPDTRSLREGDVGRAGVASRRGLALAEPQRLSALMQLLAGVYSQGGKTAASQQSMTARLEQLYNQDNERKKQFLAGIPIVGQYISGFASNYHGKGSDPALSPR